MLNEILSGIGVLQMDYPTVALPAFDFMLKLLIMERNIFEFFVFDYFRVDIVAFWLWY